MPDSLRPHGLWPTRLLCPWDFSRQGYWSGLPFPFPGDLPNPGIKLGSLVLQAGSLPTELQGKPRVLAKTGFKCTDEPRRSFKNLTKVRPNKGSLPPSGTTVSLSVPTTLAQVQSQGTQWDPETSPCHGKFLLDGDGVPVAERGRGAGLRRKPLLLVMPGESNIFAPSLLAADFWCPSHCSLRFPPKRVRKNDRRLKTQILLGLQLWFLKLN